MLARIAASLVLLLPIACATTQEKPAPDLGVHAYYPLAVGNRWVFRITPAPPGQEEKEVRITGRDPSGFFVTNVGTRIAHRPSGIFDGDRFLLEEPLETGHQWMAIPSVTTVERYEIIATGVRVNVPAGRFEDCVQVRIEQPIRARDGRQGKLVGVWSYAPGVGPVHFVQRVELPGLRPQKNAEYELVRFELAPGEG